MHHDFCAEIVFSLEPPDPFTVAEHDELTRILDNREAASVHFLQERIAPDIALNISDLSSDHSAALRGPAGA